MPEIPGQVPDPGPFPVMTQSKRHFYKLIRAHHQIDKDGRKVKDKGADQADGHRISPHGEEIETKPVSGIAAAPEERGNQQRIDQLTNLVDTGNEEHGPQIAGGGM